MARKNTGGATGSTPAPAAKTAPAPAAKPAPVASNGPGFFSWLGKMTLLTTLGVSETGHEANLYVQETLADIHRRGWMMIWGLILLIFIGFGCNAADQKWVNIILLLAYNLIISMYASRPDYLITVAYTGSMAGVIRNNATLTKGAEDFLKFYALAVLNLQLYGSIAFVVLSHIPFAERPFIFPTAVAVVIAIMQIKTAWEIPGKLGKNFVFAAAIFLLLFDFACLIPEAWSVEKTGRNLNPLAFFRVAEDKKRIGKIEAKNAENMAKANAESLKELEETVEKGKILTDEQLSILEEKRKTAARNAAGIKPISYTKEDLDWETWNTFSIAPNTWSQEKYGWKLLITFNLDKPIIIKVDATGIYQKRYKDGDSPEYYEPVDIKTGIENFNPPYKSKLPLQNRNPGCGVVMANGRFYSLGEEITISGYTEVYFSINTLQTWSDNGLPEDNFKWNKGKVEVILKKRV